MHSTETAVPRRVRKTRKQLRDALVALAIERGWDAVSVLDVCARADVGRSTFYEHFADKEDLLLSAFDDLHAALDEVRREASEPFAFALPMLEHAAENRDLMRVVAGRATAEQMLFRFRDVVETLVIADLVSLEPPERTRVARFVAGGFVQMAHGWLADGAGSAAEVADAFRALARAATPSPGTAR